MPEPGDMRELVQRAGEYPFAIPDRSFLQQGGEARELTGPVDRARRTPLLAYGANAAPEVLARKLAAAPEMPLPLVRAALTDFDVVYSAHVAAYGSIPATLLASPGTTVTVFVAFPTVEQLGLLTATEPNYELRRLAPVELRLDHGGPLTEVDAYLSRHGQLAIDGAPVALAAIPAEGRKLAALTQPEILERVASLPGLTPP